MEEAIAILANVEGRSHSSKKINKELALRGNAKENKGIESNGGKSWVRPSTRSG